MSLSRPLGGEAVPGEAPRTFGPSSDSSGPVRCYSRCLNFARARAHRFNVRGAGTAGQQESCQNTPARLIDSSIFASCLGAAGPEETVHSRLKTKHLVPHAGCVHTAEKLATVV